jgi:flavorubredoxin
MAEVDEIADGIYRIATFVADEGLTFNQFLIAGEQPLLFHTGPRTLFDDTLAGLARVIDPADLRWVSWSHFEADECGALNNFLALAPAAEPVHSELGAGLNADDFAIRPTHTLADDDVLDLGSHRVRLLVTPHVPHGWDAILALEETTGTLFASDLLAQPGASGASTDGDVVEPALDILRRYPDVIPVTPSTLSTLDRLVALHPTTLAIHHGAAYTGDAPQALADFRTQLTSFAHSGQFTSKA